MVSSFPCGLLLHQINIKQSGDISQTINTHNILNFKKHKKNLLLTDLAADNLAIWIKQISQLVIIKCFCKIFDIDVRKLFCSISHLIHSLSTRHEASNIPARITKYTSATNVNYITHLINFKKLLLLFIPCAIIPLIKITENSNTTTIL